MRRFLGAVFKCTKSLNLQRAACFGCNLALPGHFFGGVVGDRGAVLVLDDCEELLELARLLIEKVCDRAVLTAKSLNEIVTLGDATLDCQLAILDINLGPGEPSGIDAYRWLRSHDFKAPIIFLTGHARNYPLVVDAERLGDAQVFSKPMNPDILIKLVRGVTQGVSHEA